ncbi:MAG: PA2778 family cysteine peptidase, partial [Bdellovibrionota bacterium]
EFIKQTENYCGPATLTMAMKHAGHMVSVEELASQVYTPGKKGTLQLDMMSASRRQGMLAVPIQGLSNLLHELAAGHPVIILENLAFSWYPKWHYALAYGYDLSKPEIILHSGSDQAKHWSMRKFERSWMYADYWGLVVLPPSEMAISGDELSHAAAAAGLEQAGKLAEAELVYRNILKRWPGSLGALIGMGNLAYTRSAFKESVGYLKEATKLHPLSAPAWHNLAVAEGAAGKKKDARKSAAKALELANPDSLAAYQESLKDLI